PTPPQPTAPEGPAVMPTNTAPGPSPTAPTLAGNEPSGEGGSGGGSEVPNAAGTPASGAGGMGGDAATPSGGSGGVATPMPTPSPELGPAVVYVGGFDYESDTYPLRIYDLDAEAGTLTARAGSVDAGPNPSYLAV